MSTLDQVWADTKPGEFTEEQMPPVGQYIIVVPEGKFFTAKNGEATLVVAFQLQSGQRWSDVRVLTTNGVPQEGRIKAAKVLLRQLGLNPDTPPGSLQAALQSVVGKYYAVGIVASDRMSTVTGMPILNTTIIGGAQGFTPGDPGLAQQAAPAVGQSYPAPPQAFAPAVPGTAPTPVPVTQPAPGARFGDDVPWN